MSLSNPKVRPFSGWKHAWRVCNISGDFEVYYETEEGLLTAIELLSKENLANTLISAGGSDYEIARLKEGEGNGSGKRD